MLQLQQTQDSGYGTLESRMVEADQERYRAALGIIQDTATVAAQCPCHQQAARVAQQALTPPATTMDYWRHCEA